MTENILSTTQKEELISLLEAHNIQELPEDFWIDMEQWVYLFLKNFLITSFKDALAHKMKNYQDNIVFKKFDEDKNKPKYLH